MGIKVTMYDTTSSVNPKGTTLVDISDTTPVEESFEDVLVLNQTALKAMAIDAMVADSATGSVNPDAVDAAAIMKFRSTLGSNIQAPIPVDSPSSSAPEATTTEASTSSSNVYNEGLLCCSDELNAYFEEAAETYGVDVKLLKAIACAESNFNPSATSSAGAMGIMQMMPDTAAECGVTDPYDAYQSIMGGAQYISKMLDRYDGDTTLALAAYNAGPGNVDKYEGVPPFEETQNYVKKVTSYYNS